MANVIIGIHGLGNKPPAHLLEKWWKLAMIEGLAKHGYKTTLPHFELIYWSDITHRKPLDPSVKDADNPYFLDEWYVKAPEDFQVEDYSIRKKVMDYLGRQLNKIFLNEDMSLNYSFITDAIISRWFKDLEVYYSGTMLMENREVRRISEIIRGRLYDRLKRYRKDRIMLVSHSMGTIIAHDVLAFLTPAVSIDTFITTGSPLGLPVVLSRIADEQKEKGNPGNMIRTPEGVKGRWYNFSDILDKVAFNNSLADYFSENSLGIKPEDKLVINNFEINGVRNPHKSFGYLRTPEFSAILNGFIQTEKLTAVQKLSRWIVKSAKDITSKVSFRQNHE